MEEKTTLAYLLNAFMAFCFCCHAWWKISKIELLEWVGGTCPWTHPWSRLCVGACLRVTPILRFVEALRRIPRVPCRKTRRSRPRRRRRWRHRQSPLWHSSDSVNHHVTRILKYDEKEHRYSKLLILIGYTVLLESILACVLDTHRDGGVATGEGLHRHIPPKSVYIVHYI